MKSKNVIIKKINRNEFLTGYANNSASWSKEYPDAQLFDAEADDAQIQEIVKSLDGQSFDTEVIENYGLRAERTLYISIGMRDNEQVRRCPPPYILFRCIYCNRVFHFASYALTHYDSLLRVSSVYCSHCGQEHTILSYTWDLWWHNAYDFLKWKVTESKET